MVYTYKALLPKANLNAIILMKNLPQFGHILLELSQLLLALFQMYQLVLASLNPY